MPRASDPAIIHVAQSALDLARRGELGAARRTVQATIDAVGDVPMLFALIGMLACRDGEPEAALDPLRRALAAAPDDTATRGNLVQALIDTGRTHEAWTACPAAAAERDPSLRLWRLRAHLAGERGDHPAAIAALRSVVGASPRDFQSWNNLGNAYALAGNRGAAVEALGEAVRLRPDLVAIRVNHAVALAEAGDQGGAVERLYACQRDAPHDGRVVAELGPILARLHREDEAVRVFERAVDLMPDDPALRVWLGQQRIATIDLAGAEAAFRDALRLEPGHPEAHVQLAILYDYWNRPDELRALAADTVAIDVEPAARDFVCGLDRLRAGAFGAALAAFERVPDRCEPARRDFFIGQCHDRLGDADAAFAAFSAMNRRGASDSSDPVARAASSRRDLARDRAQATPEWFARWSDVDIGDDALPAPVFLLGFPRSGTTLLDTLLMGHPDVTVMEELPILRDAQDRLGGGCDLATLDAASVRAARAYYFERARSIGNWDGHTVLIDKMPLNLNKMPLIHRLFPGARFILALRHPCDVVLSCFTTMFKLNNAMANFLELQTTAGFYDASFAFWSQCREALSPAVHTVVYERMVSDPAIELRDAIAFLGLDWDDRLLDHRSTIARRSPIATASYAQVGEPLYARSSGRWRRYQRQLAPVMSVLAPWIERFGYDA